MYEEKGVKGYQRGFLNAVGISVEEALSLPSDEIWDLIFSFCNLNNTALIIDEEERLLLGNFCLLEEQAQQKIVNSFCATALKIRAELKQETA